MCRKETGTRVARRDSNLKDIATGIGKSLGKGCESKEEDSSQEAASMLLGTTSGMDGRKSRK